MYIDLHVIYLFFFPDFDETLIFSTDFQKVVRYEICENPSSGSRVLPFEQTDG